VIWVSGKTRRSRLVGSVLADFSGLFLCSRRPPVVVTWAWNRPEPFPWELSALGMILDLTSMGPRWQHNNGEMASDGVRT